MKTKNIGYILVTFFLVLGICVMFYFYTSQNTIPLKGEETKDNASSSSGKLSNGRANNSHDIKANNGLYDGNAKTIVNQINSKGSFLDMAEKNTLSSTSLTGTNDYIFDDVTKNGFDKYAFALNRKGRYINYTTEKISFLYLCDTFVKKGKQEFDNKFLELTFPKDVMDNLNHTEVYDYFYNKCMGKDVGILKGFEEEANYGCPTSLFYYYYMTGRIDKDNFSSFLSDPLVIKNTSERGQKVFTPLFKDIANSVSIDSLQCKNYLDSAY